MKHKTLSLLLTCIMLTGITTGCSKKEADNGTKPPTENSASAIENDETQSTPSISFEAVTLEGERIASADILSKSKLTMFNVWATYCNPCLNEMPYLGELVTEYDAADFQIVGIISDVLENPDEETKDLVDGLIEQTNANYMHLLLNESLYTGLLEGVSVVPTTFFVNSDGEILETVIGGKNKEDWAEKINSLLETLSENGA